MCDERRSGVNLNIVSCVNAVAQIPRESIEPVSIGWPGQADVDVALPLRYIDGKPLTFCYSSVIKPVQSCYCDLMIDMFCSSLVGRGKCFLSVFLKAGRSWDNTSRAELSAAGQLLFTECVSLLNVGGAVHGLGQLMSPYQDIVSRFC